MNCRVEITQTAKAEARQAYLWIQEHSLEAAIHWYNGLESAIDTLRTHPRRCPQAPEALFFKREIRQLLYGRRRHAYRILFEVRDEGQTVSILHVIHGARDYLRPGQPPEQNEGGA
jgi:plasmid stabilization system protein ParE